MNLESHVVEKQLVSLQLTMGNDNSLFYIVIVASIIFKICLYSTILNTEVTLIKFTC